jgi:hypothetical protein
MTATLHLAITRPVQLTLDLRAPTARRTRAVERRPYWAYVDLADLGTDLCARRPGVSALLAAERRRDGSWVGYHDLLLDNGGTSGETRPQSSRQDALASAAYGLAGHCQALLSQRNGRMTPSTTAARQLLRWLAQIDLL